MSPSELKYRIESAGLEPYYFSRQSMRFFGDTMKNFGVYREGNVWVLYRKRATKNMPAGECSRWDCETFKRVRS